MMLSIIFIYLFFLDSFLGYVVANVFARSLNNEIMLLLTDTQSVNICAPSKENMLIFKDLVLLILWGNIVIKKEEKKISYTKSCDSCAKLFSVMRLLKVGFCLMEMEETALW